MITLDYRDYSSPISIRRPLRRFVFPKFPIIYSDILSGFLRFAHLDNGI